jgi:hypothetical protein
MIDKVLRFFGLRRIYFKYGDGPEMEWEILTSPKIHWRDRNGMPRAWYDLNRLDK